MKEFNLSKWRQFIIEEASVADGNFSNDIEDRYAYIRPLMARLPDTARTEALIDFMEDGLREDDKVMFDYGFVEAMKMLGLEDQLMDDEPITPPGPEDMPGANVSPFLTDRELANSLNSLAENDEVLDEVLNEVKRYSDNAVKKVMDKYEHPKFGLIVELEEEIEKLKEKLEYWRGETTPESYRNLRHLENLIPKYKNLLQTVKHKLKLMPKGWDLKSHVEQISKYKEQLFGDGGPRVPVWSDFRFDPIDRDQEGDDWDTIRFHMNDKLYEVGNDDVLDEILKEEKFEVGDKVTMKAGGEEMEITKARKMFGSDTQAYTVKKSDGKTDEYSANQLKKA